MRLRFLERTISCPGCIQNGFGDSVHTEHLFDQGILKSNRAKRRQSQPSSRKTKRLAEMPSFHQDGPVRSWIVVFPLRARKHGSHENDKCSIPEPPLPCQRLDDLPRTRATLQKVEAMCGAIVVVQPGAQSAHISCQHVRLDGV